VFKQRYAEVLHAHARFKRLLLRDVAATATVRARNSSAQKARQPGAFAKQPRLSSARNIVASSEAAVALPGEESHAYSIRNMAKKEQADIATAAEE
jgi:hypothetical protein